MEGGATGAGGDEDQPEAQEAVEGADDEDPDLASFGGKKKKSKKKANFEDETEAADEAADLGVDGAISNFFLSNIKYFTNYIHDW
jgi:hypothetical protein